MEFGIVHHKSIAYHQLTSSYCTTRIAKALPHSRSKALWNKALSKMGFNVSAEEPTPKELFQFVKAAFEQQKNQPLDITFASGYVASVDGLSPIPFDEASRLFSSSNLVYVDELLFAALFEYIAAYYLWAKDCDDAMQFCFPYITMLLNYSCRLGILTNDDKKKELVSAIIARCDVRAINLIADLYWSCVAFAFCHEIAHIYLKHTDNAASDRDKLWEMEYEADAAGYEIYLNIIETTQENSKEPFSGIFHDYLYTAPMILFRFYEDIYFFSYRLFGEKAGNSHPKLQDRMNRLFPISESEKYTFDTAEGNILLNNYLDVSDWFREQLILKLQKGKLDQLIQEGGSFVSKSGYWESLQFQENMCDSLREEAKQREIDAEKLIGLWNRVVDIELLDEPSTNAFVWSHKGQTYSTKAFNVRFELKKLLLAAAEFGASFEIPDTPVKTVLTALVILYKLAEISTQTLNQEQAEMLIKCCELGAYDKPVMEKDLLRLSNGTSKTVDELRHLGCIALNNGAICLKEQIYIR